MGSSPQQVTVLKCQVHQAKTQKVRTDGRDEQLPVCTISVWKFERERDQVVDVRRALK
jgi:hypothetical protein